MIHIFKYKRIKIQRLRLLYMDSEDLHTVKMRQKHCEEKRKRTGLFSQMINSKFLITMLKTAVMVDQMLISSVRRKLCQQTGFLKNFNGEKQNGAT